MGPRTGFIPVSEEYKALLEWAHNYRAQATREQTISNDQMQRLIGKTSGSKQEAIEYRREGIAMINELTRAKVMIQSERPTAQQLLQAHTTPYRGLELYRRQLARLAQNSKDAALAY